MDQLGYDFRRTFSISKEDNDLNFDAFQVVARKSQEEQCNDLFKPIREVLIVGRILGVIPLSGVFKHSFKNLTFRLVISHTHYETGQDKNILNLILKRFNLQTKEFGCSCNLYHYCHTNFKSRLSFDSVVQGVKAKRPSNRTIHT